MKRKSAKVGGEKRRGEGRVRTKRREEVGGKERGGEGGREGTIRRERENGKWTSTFLARSYTSKLRSGPSCIKGG